MCVCMHITIHIHIHIKILLFSQNAKNGGEIAHIIFQKLDHAPQMALLCDTPIFNSFSELRKISILCTYRGNAAAGAFLFFQKG